MIVLHTYNDIILFNGFNTAYSLHQVTFVLVLYEVVYLPDWCSSSPIHEGAQITKASADILNTRSKIHRRRLSTRLVHQSQVC